jgi:hypothetical protein
MADFLFPIAMIVIVVIYRKQIAEAFRAFGAMFKTEVLSRTGTALASIFMVFFAILVSTAEDMAILFSIVALIVALVLEFIDKRKLKQNEKLARDYHEQNSKKVVAI